MPFLIAAKISIHSRQSEKKVINSLNDCMVEIDSKRQFVVTLRFVYLYKFCRDKRRLPALNNSTVSP